MKEVLEFGGRINSIKGLIKEEKKEFQIQFDTKFKKKIKGSMTKIKVVLKFRGLIELIRGVIEEKY